MWIFFIVFFRIYFSSQLLFGPMLSLPSQAKGKAEKVVAMVAFTGKVVYYNEEQPAVDSDPDWVWEGGGGEGKDFRGRFLPC